MREWNLKGYENEWCQIKVHNLFSGHLAQFMKVLKFQGHRIKTNAIVPNKAEYSNLLYKIGSS